MKHTEFEINRIKEQHEQMWELVNLQLSKAFQALQNNDKDLAKEILIREKKVNAQELVVDSLCENFIALFAPVAVDLRFVISLFKINNNLERIGDFAESIALFVIYQQQKQVDKALFEQLRLKEMMDTAMRMMEAARASFQDENTTKANQILMMDDAIDNINSAATKIQADYIIAHPEKAEEMLYLSAAIRRIERVGDRISNIAENIVFYIDAKELRHRVK